MIRAPGIRANVPAGVRRFVEYTNHELPQRRGHIIGADEITKNDLAGLLLRAGFPIVCRTPVGVKMFTSRSIGNDGLFCSRRLPGTSGTVQTSDDGVVLRPIYVLHEY